MSAAATHGLACLQRQRDRLHALREAVRRGERRDVSRAGVDAWVRRCERRVELAEEGRS